MEQEGDGGCHTMTWGRWRRRVSSGWTRWCCSIRSNSSSHLRGSLIIQFIEWERRQEGRRADDLDQSHTRPLSKPSATQKGQTNSWNQWQHTQLRSKTKMKVFLKCIKQNLELHHFVQFKNHFPNFPLAWCYIWICSGSPLPFHLPTWKGKSSSPGTGITDNRTDPDEVRHSVKGALIRSLWPSDSGGSFVILSKT